MEQNANWIFTFDARLSREAAEMVSARRIDCGWWWKSGKEMAKQKLEESKN